MEDILEFEQAALKEVIKYSNEMGVRNLERNIAKICRKVARNGKKEKITKSRVTEILGERREP